MSAHQDVFGLVDLGGQTRRAPLVGMQFLHERPVRPGNIFSRSAFLKPQNFISFILGHRIREHALPVAAPRVSVAISCRTPSGKAAVEISL